MNAAFNRFAADVAAEPLLVRHDEGSSLVGVLVKDS
jgi:hypothetical protein